MGNTDVLSEDSVFEYSMENVNRSLLNLMFNKYWSSEDQELNEDSLKRLKFNRSSLPEVAEKLFLVSGLLVLASREKAEIDDVGLLNEELDEMFMGIWEGRFQYNLEFARDLLEHASRITNSAYKNKLVGLNKKPIDEWFERIDMVDYDYDEIDDEVIFSSFEELIDTLKILRSTNIHDNKIIFQFEDVPGVSAINAFPYFYEPDETRQSAYPLEYLYSLPTEDDVSLRIEFNKLGYQDGGAVDLNVVDLENNSNKEYRQNYQDKRSDLGINGSLNSEVIYLFSGDYNYIKDLARVLAELLQSETLDQEKFEALQDQFLERSQEERDQLTDKDILTLILINGGPDRVLDKLLDTESENDHKDIYESIIDEFKNLGRKKKIEEKIEPKRNDMEERKKERIDVLFPTSLKETKGDEDDSPDEEVQLENLNEIKKQREKESEINTRVWAIKATSGLINVDDDDGPYVESSIDQKIDLADNIQTSVQDREIEIETASTKYGNLLSRSFKFVSAFYKGLIEYGARKIELSDTENSERSQPKSTANTEAPSEAMLRESEQYFQSALAAENRNSLGKLAKRFKTLIRKVNDNEDDYKTNLGAAIGRSYICHPDDFKKYYEEDLPDKEQDPTEGIRNISALRNFIEHEEDKERVFTEKAIREQYPQYVVDFLKYLKNGNDPQFTGVPRQPIYPLVVNLQEIERRQGNMIIYHYQIEEQNINLISKDQYYTGRQYYCLPNYERSTADWWLEPFLISREKFDSILAP